MPPIIPDRSCRAIQFRLQGGKQAFQPARAAPARLVTDSSCLLGRAFAKLELRDGELTPRRSWRTVRASVRFSDFILTKLEPILVEWEAFARTLLPVSRGMSTEHLRDHARQMLETIARDMATAQTATEQKVKSEGHKARDAGAYSAAEDHASHRLEQVSR